MFYAVMLVIEFVSIFARSTVIIIGVLDAIFIVIFVEGQVQCGYVL